MNKKMAFKKSRLAWAAAIMFTAALNGCSGAAADAVSVPVPDHSGSNILPLYNEAAKTQPGASRDIALLALSATDLDSISAIPDTAIRLSSTDHTWASVSGIKGGTYKAQLDEKIAFIQECGASKKTPFIITEDISLEEVSNTVGIAYLYANAPAYREVAASPHIRLGSGDGTFHRFTNHQISYERYVFSAARPSTLTLSVRGQLETGRFSLWLVNPDGGTVHQTEISETPGEQFFAAVTPGLWSLILINHYDQDYHIAGTLNIRGELTPAAE